MTAYLPVSSKLYYGFITVCCVFTQRRTVTPGAELELRWGVSLEHHAAIPGCLWDRGWWHSKHSATMGAWWEGWYAMCALSEGFKSVNCTVLTLSIILTLTLAVSLILTLALICHKFMKYTVQFIMKLFRFYKMHPNKLTVKCASSHCHFGGLPTVYIC